MFQAPLRIELVEAAIFVFQVLEALQLAHAHAPKLAFPRVKGGLTDAVFPANLDHCLALVLLAQNSQNLGFAEAAFFYKQLKIGEVKSYYFSLFLIGSLSGDAYKGSSCVATSTLTNQPKGEAPFRVFSSFRVIVWLHATGLFTALLGTTKR